MERNECHLLDSCLQTGIKKAFGKYYCFHQLQKELRAPVFSCFVRAFCALQQLADMSHIGIFPFSHIQQFFASCSKIYNIKKRIWRSGLCIIYKNKQIEMGWPCEQKGQIECQKNILNNKPEGKRLNGRPRNLWNCKQADLKKFKIFNWKTWSNDRDGRKRSIEEASSQGIKAKTEAWTEGRRTRGRSRKTCLDEEEKW